VEVWSQRLYNYTRVTVNSISKRKKPAYATQSITVYFAKKGRIGKLKFHYLGIY